VVGLQHHHDHDSTLDGTSSAIAVAMMKSAAMVLRPVTVASVAVGR
jgi:hypothetical protein